MNNSVKSGTENLPNRSIKERTLLAAGEMLAGWFAERENRPLDRVLDYEFRARRFLNSGERRWIGDTIYGVVRYLPRQRALLTALNLPETPENLIRSWADAPAGENAMPVAFPHTPPLADAAAWENALKTLPTPEAPHDYLRVTLSFPELLAAELEAQLGDEAIAAAQAFNTAAPVTLRVNTLKTTREKVQKSLPEAVPTRYSPFGLVLPRRVNLPEVAGFREGWFEPQEEASQLIALLAAPQPGQKVVDVGAGSGGKTLALAALLQNKGRVLALDISGRRLEELAVRAKRAGISCVQSVTLAADETGQWLPDETTQRVLERWRGLADCVLLDAPCSGSGVLRRNPDVKWRANDLQAFARLQGVLLAQASELVAPGGTLCYVSCAIETAQNEAVIAAFCAGAAGQNFEIAPFAAEFAPFASGDCFRSWPHRHGLDAFFAARLVRRGQA